MDNKGVTFFLMFMIGLSIIILALAFAPVLKQFNDDARNVTTWDGADGLDCSNVAISDFQKAACYATDISTSSFMAILIAIGLAVIVGRALLQ